MGKADDLRIPHMGVKGWGAARAQLARVHDDERRALLTSLAAHSGVQTAPGLGYLTRLLLFHADGFEWPLPPGEKLTGAEIAYIERRASEVIAPFIEAKDPRIKPRNAPMQRVV